MAKIGDVSLILKLLAGLVLGALLGFVANEAVMDVVVSLRHIFGQIIFFLVPLVIVGFITPAIVRLGQNASKILVVAVCLAYASSLGAALFSMGSGYLVIPHLSIATETETLRKLPEMVFRLDIPPLFSVMSALVTALFFGVAIAWTKSETLGKVFAELERIMTWLVTRVLIPILPFFVGLSFMGLAYEGSLTKHLPIFVTMVALVILGHFIWLTVLYGIAGIVSGRNPSQVFRYYTPAYLTAVGTMSSAATLPVALECARRSPVLSRTMVEFMVPLGATVHLCGSVLTETFFCMTISLILYGTLPSVGTMLLFCVLLGIFAVGAPGVPGGTVVASLGIVTGVLGFDQTGVALLIAIFALQDSFGTACNVTGDGALTLMLDGIFNRHGELGPLQHSGTSV
ncbi:serine/threonine sodium symporter [Desulfovibrionaceae bacterium]|uniref:Sodium:dicarboxylate symporter n=1 Tax=Desulfovibrio fairfieldensis TaxID=44742 RepID=A0A0X8JKX7_9BACT|nr:dicarboxylate/amino acid:cation symporter [Desulfovibrio fairfieldensis]AMD90668.1 sodium:dicarboxylate symporter [Desulfovibrio fairfieldensis]GKG94485.1 serine/threonine sodium symporter [Desulfovibrionaceae bacterium]GKI13035.1 serine/threonine sodium symporter [Desulfovibrionaceae bacterium]